MLFADLARRRLLSGGSYKKMEDHESAYEVLGVFQNASLAEIRKARNKLSLVFHPDKVRGQGEEKVKAYNAMMMKINDAYSILSDEEERRRHDEKLQDQRRHRSRRHESDTRPGYAYQRGSRERPRHRARPGHLGVTYQGSSHPVSFRFDGDGAHGQPAMDGAPGRDGYDYGMNGTDGHDAGPAGHGERATDMTIDLETCVSAEGYFEVFCRASRGFREVLDPNRDNLERVPLRAYESVDFTARGGRGGRGGIGGKGGNGHVGRRGEDATHDYAGTNGGPGGDGGNGGRGSNGGHGGRGGDVEVVLAREDIYLLMRVHGCDPRIGIENRLDGGIGGAAGRHGLYGHGGAGGRGGSPFFYTTTEVGYDSDGRAYTNTTFHTVPGGWPGRAGNNGSSPTYPLHAGNAGANGTFQIRVKMPDGSEQRFPKRFDLSFRSTETDKLSDLQAPKTYEFGETVLISSCIVENTGCMATPSQRVLITFGEVQGVDATRTDRIFLPRNARVAPFDKGSANEGYLRFLCPYPIVGGLGTHFDPIRQEGSMKYNAFQLGPENANSDKPMTPLSDFQERYRYFHEQDSDSFQMAYPVENPAGFRGIRSLSLEETSASREPMIPSNACR